MGRRGARGAARWRSASSRHSRTRSTPAARTELGGALAPRAAGALVAAPIHLSQPPRYTSAELDAVGLDDATISEWPAAGFDDLPPQRVGYS